jgi:hypothetical protein
LCAVPIKGGLAVRFLGALFRRKVMEATCPNCRRRIKWRRCRNCHNKDWEWTISSVYLQCRHCLVLCGEIRCPHCRCDVPADQFERVFK